MNKEKLIKTVQSWNVKSGAEYRGFRCAHCQKYMHKAWHIWLDDKGYKCEVHLCKNCFKEYDEKEI